MDYTEKPAKADKIYIPGEINKLQVGMRQIKLSDTYIIHPDNTQTAKTNTPVTIYDTGGPYSDPSYIPNIKEGIPRICEGWYGRRKDIQENESAVNTPQKGSFPNRQPVYRAKGEKRITQMFYAKKRIITPEMEYVAIRENQQIEALGLKSYITPDFVRKEIASGRAIIPANINHPEAEPMIIGKRFLVKTNTNLFHYEYPTEKAVKQMISFCLCGSDTFSDFSTDPNCHQRREWLIRNCPVPLGTSPIFQALTKAENKPENLSWELFRDTLIEQAEQGVDFMAIHAAIRKKHLNLIENRLTSPASQSAKIITQWMKSHKEENFLYTHFKEICEIFKTYDITISLGSGFRPGSIYDASDRAQFTELSEMRKLIETAWDQSVQIMSEGPGHISLNKIEANIKEHKYHCKDVPLFTRGITTTDIAGSNNHIASAIGNAHIAWLGASIISNFDIHSENPPMEKEVKQGIIAQKIAAHVADIAKGHPGAQVRDNALSKARQEGRINDIHQLLLNYE
ncbi:MAG: phosphomethylpyrimidine synthase ThiC [Tannerella sp.]|jgi:phosphomethylpyrimidine synthase|nr:phosphomethylpyrimidine synthase ThiC [Tannerella sp.]